MKGGSYDSDGYYYPSRGHLFRGYKDRPSHAQIYFKVKDDETSVKNSQHNVNNFQYQIVNLLA